MVEMVSVMNMLFQKLIAIAVSIEFMKEQMRSIVY